MFVITMLGAFAIASSSAAQQGPSDAVRWDFDQRHRYAVEANMRLPEMIWLGTRFNTQARFDAMHVRMVLQCEPGVKETRRSWTLQCELENVGFSAEALPQEVGLVQEIVTELDERLTGAVVRLQMRNDGRLTNINLRNLRRRNQRFAFINENLRLVLSRALAGFDLPLPRNTEDNAWVQHSSWMMLAPTRYGSASSSEIVHKVTDVQPTSLTITSAGRGLVVPDDGWNKYAARVEGQTVFDTVNGRILDRTWTLVGGPTASSVIAQGTEGYPYIVHGRVVALSEGQAWDVGESEELPRSRPSLTAIQQGRVDPMPR